jgi:NADH dehydrogenase (ubiquinone) 1 alpha subcomplex subunit 8
MDDAKRGYFPEDEELAVTSAPLMAAAFYIGDQCKVQNDDFMLCKQAQNQHPEHCLKEGLRVTRCAQHVFHQLSENCREEFTAYWKCLDNNNQKYMFCRDEEQSQNDCVLKRLGWSKKLWAANGPEAGYKPQGELPAADVSQYKRFVSSHKREADPSSVTLN